MALSPGQLLLMRRQGPGMAPGGTPRLAPAPGAAAPGGGGGADIGQALSGLLRQLGGAGREDYLTQVLGNTKRILAVLIAKYNQSHPEVVRHITRGFTGIDAALTAAKKADESQQQQQSMAGPPLGFSGAQTEMTPPPGQGGIGAAA